MEVLTCTTLQYDKKSYSLKNSVSESVHVGELNCVAHAKQMPLDNKGDHLSPNSKVTDIIQSYCPEMDGEVQSLERSHNESTIHSDNDVNEQKSSSNQLDHEGEYLDEQSHYGEACLDFQNSHVDVNTIDSEPSCKNKEEDPSVSTSMLPEHDESLALWVKWRGKWQAGIKCERVDWPLATVKAKPTHDRKDYIVIFFPHKKNYSWADTMLVCSIDELPQPIAHRSHKIGVQLVGDLTVARRFIMKKLMIGMLNIVDQLPTQVLKETARDVAVWRGFANKASQCKGYSDLGKLLLRLPKMLLQKFIDANWLQYSFDLWVKKCQNAQSAESVELLKEELANSILWNEVNALRDQGQPPLGPEWKMWKHEVIKCFSTTHPVSGGEDIGLPQYGIEQLITESPVMKGLQMSRKRPKLEVRRAEPHPSQVESKNSGDVNVEIDSIFFASQSTEIVNNSVVGSLTMDFSSNTVNPCEDVHVDTSIVVFQSKDVELIPRNGVVETKSIVSKIRNHQCLAFIEAKNRRCSRWANEGDDYCCVHLASHSSNKSSSMDVSPSADSPMCQGTTNLGLRCKHQSLPRSSYCKKHRSHGDVIKPFSSPGQLKRKHDYLVDDALNTQCRDIVLYREDQTPLIDHPVSVIEENASQDAVEEPEMKSSEIIHCMGSGLEDGSAHCLESPKKHNMYCDKHVPNWLKRARNGKSRVISKEVFLDLLRTCSSKKQKMHLHQACEAFYQLFKSILSVRNQVPKEIQFQWALSEASRDLQVGEILMKLVSREKERLRRIWGFDVNSDTKVPSSPLHEQAVMPLEEGHYSDGTLKCKICSEEFSDDQTLGAHWIDNHNKEAQWLFRGYACAICLDSFTDKKVLETHVQERHHAQFVDHCMLIQCIPCGSHFGNLDELLSHALSVHTEGFRQPNIEKQHHLSVNSQQVSMPSNPTSVESNPKNQSMVRRFICRFCGMKFDLLPDLGRHHQAAHMGPSLLSSRPKKNGLRFYAHKLKSGRLTRPRFKNGIGASSYRFRNKGTLVLKKRIQPVNPLSVGGINFQSRVINSASIIRLTEAQCSTIARMLSSEAQRTKARPNKHEILAVARSTCCKFGLQRILEQKYGMLPERVCLKAAKLCCDHNIQVEWHQEGFNCPKGCKPPEDQGLVSVSNLTLNENARYSAPLARPPQESWEMDECHYVIGSCHLRRKQMQTTIILCDDISFGQETVPVPCVVDKNLLDSLHTPTYILDGQVIFMPWESFTYRKKPRFDRSFDVNVQLGCDCARSTCSPESCDHMYLFNCDNENAKDIYGQLMEGRFPYDDNRRLVLEEGCLVYECNHLCKCSRSCPNKVLQNGLHVKLEVFKTVKKGWAVRANESILRGTFICEFVGEVIHVQEANRRRKRYGKEHCSYFYDLGQHMQLVREFTEGETRHIVDATKYGNVSRFINHSCSPNLSSHLVLVESMDFRFAHVGFFAKQDIKPGEELTYDYQCELDSGEGLPCLCGALNCRGRVH